MRVLLVGPDPVHCKGGMSTVIEEIKEDPGLNETFDIETYESYVDGNRLKVLLYSVFAFIKFYVTKRNFDLYHIHMASYGSTFRKGFYVRAVKRWNKKLILHIHGAEYMIFYEKSRWKQKIVSLLQAADLVIALSAAWKKVFDETFGLTNCAVLENAVDIQRFHTAGFPGHDLPNTLVMLGRLGERKGTYDLIRAIKLVRKKVPDVICYLAGDGESGKCRSLIAEEKLEKHIVIAGWVNFDEKVELLRKSSILVLPSYNEGLPMAILEGMASGKAVISTTVGAIPELVCEEGGILIEPGDVRALAGAIEKFCMDKEQTRKAGEFNKKLIEAKYDMKVMREKLAGYYNMFA